MSKYLLIIFFICGFAKAEVNVYQVDSCRRVFPDSPAEQFFFLEPLSIPRNSVIPLQFVIKSTDNLSAQLRIKNLENEAGKDFKGTVAIYRVDTVHVEANSNSGGTQAGKPAQKPYNVNLIREAPFDVAEVLVKASNINLKKNVNHVVLCDIEISKDCEPGVYTGKFLVKTENLQTEEPFSIVVHTTILPSRYALKTSHWLSTDPQDLVLTNLPKPWSPEHWDAILNAAKVLYDFGDRVVTIDTFYTQNPMVQTIINENGTLDFDFTKFDKWVKMFLEIGYEQIECVAVSGHWIHTSEDIYGVERKTGEKKLLFPKGYCLEKLSEFKKKYEWPKYRDEFVKSSDYRKKTEIFSKFLVAFFDSMYQHLQKKDWKDIYVQQLLDEPRTVQDYAYLSTLARKHLPGIKISNAIHAYGVDDYEQFSQYNDMWIMEMALLAKAKTRDIITDRKNKGLGTGIYVLAKGSNWPNRLLDRPLLDNRTQPWIFFSYGIDYYIHWAANRYRGANPYLTSVGPVPGGSQSPGHPVGGNWIFYPGPNGLLPSMRAVAFREGLIDYTLLSMLAKKDKARAQEITNSITQDIYNSQKEPMSYYIARKNLLDALDTLQ